MDKKGEIVLELVEIFRRNKELIEEYFNLLDVGMINENMRIKGYIGMEIYEMNRREYEKAMEMILKKSLIIRRKSEELLFKIKDSQK